MIADDEGNNVSENGSSEYQERKDADHKAVKEACLRLMRRFDCVQIFASRYDRSEDNTDDETVSIQYGKGNWLARYGLAKRYVLMNDQEFKKSYDESEGFD